MHGSWIGAVAAMAVVLPELNRNFTLKEQKKNNMGHMARVQSNTLVCCNSPHDSDVWLISPLAQIGRLELQLHAKPALNKSDWSS